MGDVRRWELSVGLLKPVIACDVARGAAQRVRGAQYRVAGAKEGGLPLLCCKTNHAGQDYKWHHGQDSRLACLLQSTMAYCGIERLLVPSALQAAGQLDAN